MKPPLRCASFLGSTILMAGLGFADGGLSRATVFSSGQDAAPTTPAPVAASQPRELTLEQRADVFMARKNFADAVDYYYRALKQSNFNDAGLWNKMGIAYQQESKYYSARKAFARATRANKDFADAWNNIGTTLFAEKRYGKSVPYYQHAIKLRADTAVFHLNLGSSYLRLKKYALASQEFETTLSLDPKVLSPDSRVGTVVHASGSDVDYYFYMAKALASKGRAENAVRFLRRALEDGYSNLTAIADDPDFKKISQDPAFVELMRNLPVAIKN